MADLTLCTEQEARMFRVAHDEYMRRLSRMTKAQLRVEFAGIQVDRGLVTLHGGPVTKEDHIRECAQARYPVARLNMTIHVLSHGVIYPDCVWCTGPRECFNCGATAAERCKSWCGARESRRQPVSP